MWFTVADFCHDGKDVLLHMSFLCFNQLRGSLEGNTKKRPDLFPMKSTLRFTSIHWQLRRRNPYLPLIKTGSKDTGCLDEICMTRASLARVFPFKVMLTFTPCTENPPLSFFSKLSSDGSICDSFPLRSFCMPWLADPSK